MDPPARNAMWRFGYPNPVNYNDNELFCGGYAVQWEHNNGKCGICGDAYHLKSPRPHEAGGEFGRGIISRYYTAGQVLSKWLLGEVLFCQTSIFFPFANRKLRWKWNSLPIISDALKCIFARIIIHDMKLLRSVSIVILYTFPVPESIVF